MVVFVKLTLSTLCLVAGVLPGQAQTFSPPPSNLMAVQGWLNKAANPASHAFKARQVDKDDQGKTVSRFDHFFKGVRVMKSEGVVITGQDGIPQRATYAYGRLLEPTDLDVGPSFPPAKALQLAGVKAAQAPIGWLKPTVELAIEPLLETFLKENPLPVFGEPGPGSNAQAYGRELKGFRLVYLVTGWDTAKQDVICHKLDAQTGQEIETYSTSSCATGTAKGLYNPNASITVAQSGSTYSLVNGIFSTYWSGGSLYTGGSPIFGDNQKS